jgi:hypothetical protein
MPIRPLTSIIAQYRLLYKYYSGVAQGHKNHDDDDSPDDIASRDSQKKKPWGGARLGLAANGQSHQSLNTRSIYYCLLNDYLQDGRRVRSSPGTVGVVQERIDRGKDDWEFKKKFIAGCQTTGKGPSLRPK